MLVSSRLQSPSPNVANAVEDNGHGLLRDVTVSLFLSCLLCLLWIGAVRCVLHCSLADRRQVPPRPEATAALPAPVDMSPRFIVPAGGRLGAHRQSGGLAAATLLNQL